MSEKRILFAVPDAEVVAEYRRVFPEPWEIVVASKGPEALAALAGAPFDVVLTELELPEMDGADLLNHARKHHPEALGFILASDADRERVMKKVQGAHQFLSKPCDPSLMRQQVERALALDLWIANKRMRELVGRIRTFPTVPSLYLEVLAALRSPSATTEEVGRIIAKDLAMMTKLLRVINSASFGLSRRINDPVEAVGLMGFDAVKSMVMTIKLLSQYDKVKPVYFSIDKMWRHSTDVARVAKQLAVLETEDRALGETAFTAGLIHDLGKVVLASNFDEQYRGAQSLARKQKLPSWEVEKEIFGASHGEIGAYLLGLWGMPLDLLEVAALHHQPGRCIVKEFNALTALHVANAFEHEANPDQESGGLDSQVDLGYLGELGLAERLPEWRENLQQIAEGKPVTKAKRPAPSPMTMKMAEPAALPGATRATNLAAVAATEQASSKLGTTESSWLAMRRSWLYLAGGALLLTTFVGGILLTTPKFDQVISEPAKESNSVAAIPEEAPAPVAASQPSNELPVETPALLPALTVRARTPEVESNKSAPKPVKPKALGFDDLKLQGILYTTGNPSAIVSGNSVHVNDRVAGATVVSITPTTVTLEYQTRLKTLVLK